MNRMLRIRLAARTLRVLCSLTGHPLDPKVPYNGRRCTCGARDLDWEKLP